MSFPAFLVYHSVLFCATRPFLTLMSILVQETSLELLVVSEDGIVQSICEQPIFGKIKDLKLLPWNERYRSSQHQVAEVLALGIWLLKANHFLCYVNISAD